MTSVVACCFSFCKFWIVTHILYSKEKLPLPNHSQDCQCPHSECKVRPLGILNSSLSIKSEQQRERISTHFKYSGSPHHMNTTNR